MPESLYRVSIHCTAADHASAADLVLPAAMTVGQLLPSIVAAVGAPGDLPRRWYLAPPGGAPLDESMTLAQNEVHDGAVLVLTARVPVAPRSYGLIHALTAAAPTPTPPPTSRMFAGLWTCAVGMAAVLCAGIGTGGPTRVIVSAVVAVAVTAVAFASRRLALTAAAATSVQSLAVASVAILGFVAVPSDSGPGNVFLAAAAAASLGVVLLRLTDGSVETMHAVVAFAVIAGIGAAVAALFPLDVQAFGACLGALGIAALSLSPRMSIILAGLTPDEASPAGDVDVVAARGHRILCGLVAGASAAAALGAVSVAAGGYGSVTFAAIAFDAAIGLALLSRGRSHASGRCRTALGVTGFCALTAMFVLVVAWSPQYGNWVGAAAVAVGLAAMCSLGPASLTNAGILRIAEAAEYVALAAVAPLACWLAGIFDVVRGFGM